MSSFHAANLYQILIEALISLNFIASSCKLEDNMMTHDALTHDVIISSLQYFLWHHIGILVYVYIYKTGFPSLRINFNDMHHINFIKECYEIITYVCMVNH